VGLGVLLVGGAVSLRRMRTCGRPYIAAMDEVLGDKTSARDHLQKALDVYKILVITDTNYTERIKEAETALASLGEPS